MSMGNNSGGVGQFGEQNEPDDLVPEKTFECFTITGLNSFHCPNFGHTAPFGVLGQMKRVNSEPNSVTSRGRVFLGE